MRLPTITLKKSRLLFVCLFVLVGIGYCMGQNASTRCEGRYTKAVADYRLGYYNKAIAAFDGYSADCANDDSKLYLNSIYYNALSYFKSGNYGAASLTVVLGNNESKRLGNDGMKSCFGQVEGLISFGCGRYENAIRQLSVLSDTEAGNDTEAQSLNSFYIGKSYWMLGQQQKAVPFLKAVDANFNKHGYIHPDVREAYELLIGFYNDNPREQIKYITQLEKADAIMAEQYPVLFAKTAKQYDKDTLWRMKEDAESNPIKWLALLLVLTLLFLIRRYHKGKKEVPHSETVLSTQFSDELADSIIQKLEQQTDKKYLDSADVLQLFNITDMTLYRWRKNGDIPFAKIGGKLVYPKKAILAMLQARLDNKYDPINIKKHQKGE